MAKRRNLKKEKAQRNLAYARQFRKKTQFQSRYKSYSGLNKSENEDRENKKNDENQDEN
jgi:hypothetical protein